ncbi:COG1470 family protein [Actinokineospora sp. 24-640]
MRDTRCAGGEAVGPGRPMGQRALPDPAPRAASRVRATLATLPGMGATTSLAGRELAATPGQTVTTSVRVNNSGPLVDQFTVDVVGESREWATVSPQVVNLMPGQDAEVVVTFAPPRSAEVPAGPVPFGVRVASREDPLGSRVEEGAVLVAPFTDLQVELVPKTSHCRRQARHELVVDNAGNSPIAVELHTSDPEDQLQLTLDHTALTVQPGTSAFLKLRARPHDRFLRGPDRRLPFQVTAIAPETPPVHANGTVVQQQLLPKWLLPALVILLVLAIVLATLWFTVLKPTLKSAAREAAVEAAVEQQAELTAKADNAAAQAAAAEQKADAAQKAVQDGGLAPSAAPEVVSPGGVDISSGSTVDFRITADSPLQPDSTVFTTFTAEPGVPAEKTLVITDILLQNPRGDAGLLQLRRGDRVLLEVGLANFRDLDYHLVEPWTFAPGEELVLAVSCQAPTNVTCKPAASFSGRLAG